MLTIPQSEFRNDNSEDAVKQQQLWVNICRYENFMAAWQRVRANMGAPGVDRVSVADFEQNLQQNLSLLLETVKQGTYQPLPYLSFSRPKPSGKMRELKIPSVRDRVVQEAVLLRLRPVFEKTFLSCSYAYRPGKSALKAADRVLRLIKKGRHWALNADIEQFFDNVNHDLLMQFVADSVDEKNVLKLISRIIRKNGSTQAGTGIPQGAAISPLLANLYLHQLDKVMIRAKWCYLRYADNFVTLCFTQAEAQQALDRASDCLTSTLKLNLNREKTEIVNAKEGMVFLGYHFDEHGKRPAGPAMESLKRKIDTMIGSAEHVSGAELTKKLDDMIRGWANYFRLDQTDRNKLMQEVNQKWGSQADSVPVNILRAALSLHFGDKRQAQEIVEHAPVTDLNDADMQYQWGVICELSDKQQEAIDSYLGAFRLDSGHAGAALRMGLHYLKHGSLDRAIRFLQKAVQLNPDSGLTHYSLATALEQLSLHGAAQKAFTRAFKLDPRLKKHKTSLASGKKTETQVDIGKYSESDITLYRKLFSGREGVFAKQWINHEGRMGYTPVYKALSDSAIRAHFQGSETVAVYLMRSDNTVQFAVIDIDVSRQARAEIPDAMQDFPQWEQIAHRQAVRILQSSQKLGLEPCIERSGYKGCHVWYFFEQPFPARDAVQLLKKIAATVGEIPPGLTLEIFPRETKVAASALGSMIKVPLGIHKLTNRRCLFLDVNGAPCRHQFDYLHRIRRIDKAAFYKALDQLRMGEFGRNEIKTDTSKAEKMIEACNVLKYLTEKADKQRHLTHIDRLTLLHTVGHVNKYLLHQIIGKTYNYNHRITERWIQRLKGSPVSCPKIRTWQQHITPGIGCYCRFPESEGSYPTPLLHVEPNRKVSKQNNKKADLPDASVQKAAPQPAASQNPEHIQQIVEEYLELRRQSHDLNIKKQELEKNLENIFRQQQCESIELKIGTLKRITQGDEVQWLIEI